LAGFTSCCGLRYCPARPKGGKAAHRLRQQLRLRLFPSLQNGEDSQLLEKIARHLIELRPHWRGDDHAEIEWVALEVGLRRDALDLLNGVPGDERLLRGLQDVLVLGREVAARRIGWRRR